MRETIQELRYYVFNFKTREGRALFTAKRSRVQKALQGVTSRSEWIEWDPEADGRTQEGGMDGLEASAVKRALRNGHDSSYDGLTAVVARHRAKEVLQRVLLLEGW